jgi:hypothetical protein
MLNGVDVSAITSPGSKPSISRAGEEPASITSVDWWSAAKVIGPVPAAVEALSSSLPESIVTPPMKVLPPSRSTVPASAMTSAIASKPSAPGQVLVPLKKDSAAEAAAALAARGGSAEKEIVSHHRQRTAGLNENVAPRAQAAARRVGAAAKPTRAAGAKSLVAAAAAAVVGQFDCGYAIMSGSAGSHLYLLI